MEPIRHPAVRKQKRSYDPYSNVHLHTGLWWALRGPLPPLEISSLSPGLHVTSPESTHPPLGIGHWRFWAGFHQVGTGM